MMPNDRLGLINALNDLPVAQFNDLLVKLQPPAGLIPNPSAPQGDRVIALLKWAEGAEGSGLDKVHAELQQVLVDPETNEKLTHPGAVSVGGSVNNAFIVTGSGNNIYTSFWSRKSVGLASLSIIVLFTIALYFWQRKDPEKMPAGTFNVAVADFITVGQNGNIQRLDEGKKVSNLLVGSLEGAKSRQSINPDYQGFEVKNWYLSKNSITLPGNSTTELAENVGSSSKSVNANILIYGYLTKTSDESKRLLTLYLYVSPDKPVQYTGLVDAFDDRAIKGVFKIGQPQLVNIQDEGKVESVLASRANPLYLLLAGMYYSSNPITALKFFEKAEKFLDNELIKEEWENGAGKEIFYFCMGQVALFIANDSHTNPVAAKKYIQQAETAFNKAKSVNSKYLRTLVGLGSIYYSRAQLNYMKFYEIADNQKIAKSIKTQLQKNADADLGKAFDFYKSILAQLPHSEPDPWSEYAAKIGLGVVWNEEAYRYSDSDKKKAGVLAEKTVEAMQKILNPLGQLRNYRLLAQAYLTLGTAYVYKYYIQDERAVPNIKLKLRQQAIDAFLLCQSQVSKAPSDLYLNQQIIENCKDSNQKFQEQ
jgi:hypothetical protein